MKAILTLLLMCIFHFINAQSISNYIVVDQFGYRPSSEKVAVIRNPMSGFDAQESFTPGQTYALINAQTGITEFTAPLQSWNNGNEDESSGDMAWWFDFSSFQTQGSYYVLDVDQNVKSFEFDINPNVYNEALKHAVRTFYYQRAGYAKEETYAGEKWADEASHLGFRQDSQCRKFDDQNNASLERDLQGGWYDAGDYNKYTPWTANYIIDLLKAYEENPNAWGDNYCLPYSDNGIPDLIDEVRWGLEYLLRLQEDDGSLISVVSLSHENPPSEANGPSLYGGVNTTSALSAAGAYAYGAKVFKELGQNDFSQTLTQSAIAAWNWAELNPDVIWKNNSEEFNSVGIGAGQQETDDYGRFAYKIRAAIHLFETTGESEYKDFVDNNYQDIHLIQWNFAFPFEQDNQDNLLYYASLSNANTQVSNAIRSVYSNAMEGTDNFQAFDNEQDPYLSHLKDYVWGSNGTKARKGLMYTGYVNNNVNSQNDEDASKAAERYVHYFHGVNPLGLTYLSNMGEYGAEKSVNQFYHAWFDDGSDWDQAGVDLYGPAPGFVVGGANPTYDWDGCCPGGCAGRTCDVTQRDRIRNQPKQKAYDQFNTNWPMNSWSVTENSGGYQVAYIRLISHFIGDVNSGEPSCQAAPNTVTGLIDNSIEKDVDIFPNPTTNHIFIQDKSLRKVRLLDVQGIVIKETELSTGEGKLDLSTLPNGVYLLELYDQQSIITKRRVVKVSK